MMNQLLMSVLSQRKSVPVEPGENYVRFVSAESRTIKPKYTNSGITLQYSVNSGATWTTIASESETTSATEHWFRGQATGTKTLFTSSTTTNAWVFSGDSDLAVYGNLNFLLCDTLGDEEAPTNLENNAYAYMFYNCTSLTVAPELPATTLADSCYRSMFCGCTSLTTAPELPATTLKDNCYRSMFNGCTLLTTAPELPATTLKDYCYYYMFRGCTSFKVSETNTGSYTYAWRIPTSGTGTTASSWNGYMLYETGGTFTYNPTINTTYYVENEPVSSENYVRFYDFQGTGNTLLKTETVISGGNATPPADPTRTGYTWLGWDKSYTNVQSNLDVYGTWQINTYTVRFYDYQGGTILSTQTVNHGASATAPTQPTRTGYQFTGWSSPYTNITTNTDIYGQWATSACFIEGTQISLANGLTKNVEDITYDDELLVWNFDEGKFDTAKPIWIKEKEVATKYLESTYSDGTILKTTGRMPSAHRIFNKELNKFTSLGKEETPIGTTTFTSSGEEVTLTNIKYVNDTVNYYDIITDKHINLFANTILTSCRLSNLYTIKDMKYIKDDRELNENFGIPEDLFKGLRIAEQPINLNAENFNTTIEQYIKRIMYKQKEKK